VLSSMQMAALGEIPNVSGKTIDKAIV